MKILTICPSYNRPELCKQMLKSWHETILGDNTMILGLDIGDPSLLGYPKEANRVMCKNGSTVTEVINSIWAKYPDYDFYHIINDDVIFHTIGYDVKLANIINGEGISYGNDLFQGQSLPTFPFISAGMAKAMGYLQLPSLNRYCGDTIWGDIGRLCGNLHYLGEVKIEHLHKLAGKGTDDVDMRVYHEDLKTYLQWRLHLNSIERDRIMGVLK